MMKINVHPPLPQWLTRLAAVTLATGVALIALNFPKTKYNGLSLSVDGQRFQPITWLWIDVVTLWDRDKPVLIQGYLWNERAGDHTFSVTSDGAVEMRIGGDLGYSRENRVGVSAESFTTALPAGAVPITVTYRTADPPTPRFEVSLSENGQLIAPWRLYPDKPTAELIGRQRAAWRGIWLGIAFVVMGALLGVMIALRSLDVSRNDWLAIGGTTALAITVRIAVAVERYHTGPDFYAMVSIWDNFVAMARGVIAGYYSLPGSYAQQGTIIYLTLVQAALGPALLPHYIVSAVLGGISVVFVLGATWAIFGRSVGLLAGIMMALYAPMVHYQTTLQIVVPATLIASICLALGAWLIRRPNLNVAAGYGAAVGLGLLTRGPLIAFGLSGLLAVAVPRQQSLRRRLVSSIVIAIAAVITLLPMMLANFSIGLYSVSSNRAAFPIAFFRGNNRDTFGINEYMTDRERLARARVGDEAKFNGETVRDIRSDAGHWIQLMFHKAGLFWAGREYSDRMIDFYATGLDYSGTLRAVWLGGLYNLTALAGLAGVGALIAAHQKQNRAAVSFLVSTLFVFMLTTIVFPVTGRVRAPIQPALFPLAAFGIVSIANGLRDPRASWRPVSAAVSIVTIATLIVYYLETQLPLPTVVSKLPASAVETSVDFDSKVRLIGFDALDSDFRSDGYLDVTLYWMALQPLDSGSTLLIHLLNPSLQRLGGIDRALGDANFPIYPSSHWKVGEIVRQSYYVPLPKIDGAVPIRIIVGLYDSREQRLPITSSAVETLDATAAVITGLSILPAPSAPAPELPRPLEISAGSDLQIVGTDLPAQYEFDSKSNALDVQLDWQARTHPAYRYHMFLHLMDGNGNLVSQFDGPPVADFPTDTWPPDRTWRGSYQIPLPTDLPSGEYTLAAGLYRLSDLGRLPLSGPQELLLPEDRFLLSTIHVAP